MKCPSCGLLLDDHDKSCYNCGTGVVIHRNTTKNTAGAFPLSKTKKKGLLWMFGPTVVFAIILFVRVFVGFLEQGSRELPALKLMLGIFALLALIVAIIGFFIGIRLLQKQELTPGGTYDPRSGKGKLSEIPPEIRHWNWGAAGLGLIWGAYYNIWISLVAFIPLTNLVWWIFMGMYGNEWAWRKNKWESVEQFEAVQNKWKPWGIGIFIFWIIINLLQIIGMAKSL